jgi:hypothetical protein
MYSREQLLEVVRRSPALVALHDRQGWLDLFSEDALIEDPIGTPPAGKASGFLARFWDTFIAPHEIRFEVKRDHFLGRDVMRDVLIHTRINDHVQIDVPAYLLYQLEERDGALHVRRMAAHWELAKLSLGALKLGPRAWLPMTRLFARMLARMGLRWVGGYLSALWAGIGTRAVAALGELSAAVERRDASALSAGFDGGAEIELGDRRLAPPQLLDALPAGSRVVFESPVVAGWTASFRYRIEGPAPSEGVGLMLFARDSGKIAQARLFAA